MSRQSRSIMPDRRVTQPTYSQNHNYTQRRRGSSPSQASPRSPNFDTNDYDSSQLEREVNNYSNTQFERDFNEIIGARYRQNDDRESTGSEERPAKRRKEMSPTQPGRGIRKIVDLYHDLHELIDKARAHTHQNTTASGSASGGGFGGMTEKEIEKEKKDRLRCHRALQLLNQLIPGFEQKALATENVIGYCSPLQSGANDARSDDTGRLKVVIAEWLNARPETIATGRLLSSKSKEERGFGNDITGRLLCPITHEWDDPAVRARLHNAEDKAVMTNYFLRCLYEDEDGDTESIDNGYLKGPLLVRVYKYIFTSPSSAYAEDGPTESSSRRRDVACTVGLNNHVTPRSIAYAATQLIFALNSARDWKKRHAGFYYPSFYNFLVDYFEDDDTDEFSKAKAEELLQWWNYQIFGSINSNGGGDDSYQAMESSKQMLQEARQKRAAALAD